MADEDFTHVVCNRVQDGEPNVRGATRDTCSVCKTHVWVAPSSFLYTLRLPVLCVPCAINRWIESGETLEIGMPSAEQMRELAAAGLTLPKKAVHEATRKQLEQMIKTRRKFS